MSTLIVIGTIVFPVLLLAVQRFLKRWGFVIDLLALFCGYIFAAVSALAVYEIIRDGTIFMTSIHKVFANAWFLIAGGYLGIYGLAKLFNCIIKQYTN